MVWPVAAAALPLGFAVAEATGVRPVGGAVMVALLGWCAWRRREAPAAFRIAVGAVAVVCFVASHFLHDALTVPGAVGLAGVVTGATAWRLLDRAPVGASPEARRTSTAH